MKRILYCVVVLSLSAACKKNRPGFIPDNPQPNPVMLYKNLNNYEITFGKSLVIDLNNDGVSDFYFNTILIGDPVLQRDRLQFLVNSKIQSYLLSNTLGQTPVLDKEDTIYPYHTGYDWFEVSSITLTEKIFPVGGAAYWEGIWKQADHKYLPIQVKKNGKVFFGWIEISVMMAEEKLILHKAAISTEPGKTVKAGI